MTLVEACFHASQLPPQEWTMETLTAYPSGAFLKTFVLETGESVRIRGRTFQSIFNHSAMARERTVSLIEALVWTGLTSSNGDARRAIKAGAIRLNSKQIRDDKRILSAMDALPNLDAIVIENGCYNYGIIELCD